MVPGGVPTASINVSKEIWPCGVAPDAGDPVPAPSCGGVVGLFLTDDRTSVSVGGSFRFLCIAFAA